MHRVDQHPVGRRPKVAQQEKEKPNGRQIEGHHGELRGRHTLADPGYGVIEDLRRRRIDGSGITGAVDMRIDRVVTERSQDVVAGDVVVRIDSGRLYSPGPDIAVDIAGKIRRENY